MTIDYRAARELYIRQRIIESIEHDPRLAGRPVPEIIREARAQAIEEWGVLPPRPRDRLLAVADLSDQPPLGDGESFTVAPEDYVPVNDTARIDLNAADAPRSEYD